MDIPLIYILIIAEVLLIFFGISITLVIIMLRKSKTRQSPDNQAMHLADTEVIELGNSYIDFLEQAMERNSVKITQQQNIENDGAKENALNSDGDMETASPAPNEEQSELLQARTQFLLMEKAAAEKTEHEIHFWDSVYAGMISLLEQFKTTETTMGAAVSEAQKTESKEKVFYIETQGKKIDSEVNKLKDIIYDQENALSSMKKALVGAEEEHPEDSKSLKLLKEQIGIIETKLDDSKMCMEILEMENDRLQQEVDSMEARHNALFKDALDEKQEENDSVIDLVQMKEVVEDQENKIRLLIETIESLEIDASQAEKLKKTIGEFARTSQEMMGCITILEEENERLQVSTELENQSGQIPDSEELDVMTTKISDLEEGLIKKDVAFAQLQDEFNSMEAEYLAMYEAMHGNNS